MARFLALSVSALCLVACSSETEIEEVDVLEPPLEPVASKLLLPLPDSTNTMIESEDLSIRIKALANDVFEGRGPGSVAGEAAADWVAAEMARVGLQPGASDDWFQTVGMVNQTADEAMSSLTISVEGNADPLTLKEDAVIWTKRQKEMDVSFDSSEVVFVGYGAVAPEYNWNDYEGLDVEGKTVVILVNDPGYATQDPALFNGNAMTYYGRWVYKFEEAARQGATAAIIVHETEPASYGWEVVRNSWSGAQSDLVRANGGEDRVMMEGWITLETAMEVFTEAGFDFTELKEQAKTAGFNPVPLGELKASGRIVQSVETTTSRNVVGMIKGSTTPDEYVLYMAHWDHLGKAISPEDQGNFTFTEDKIYNGAVDNATGMSGLLEIAERMATETPERSVLFVAVTLEESGLLGSAYYGENPTVPLNHIVAGMNMDGILPIGPTKDMVVVGFGASELEDRLAALLAEQDRVIAPDPTPEAGYFYRSDHVSLAKKGVPMLYADGGEDHREFGTSYGKAIAEEYRALRYHKPADEWSADWDLTGMQEDMNILFQLGLDLANSEDWPNWYDGNEFRALRDEMMQTE